MGSLHNTRILRFLLVLSAVILTIFIYASYSSNSSLTPPHIRSVGAPPSAGVASALTGQQQADVQSSAIGNLTRPQHANAIEGQRKKQDRKAATAAGAVPAGVAAASGLLYAVRKEHRKPTIDVDAADGGGNGVDEELMVDEGVLEPLVSNDLLEEQYVQNVDIMGNIVNTNNSSVPLPNAPQAQKDGSLNYALQQEQLQEEGHELRNQNALEQSAHASLNQQQQQQQQQQHQQQNQIVYSNLDKIPDSDVLIPTSNLQKFIENADKILKNITAPPSVAASVAGKAAEKLLPVASPPAESDKRNEHATGDGNDDDNALPPSVVMTIKTGNHGPPPPPSAPVIVAHKAAAKAVSSNANVNATMSRAAVDPTKGILTQRIYESGHMNEQLNVAKLCPDAGADLKLLILITSAQAHADARMAIRQTWAHCGTRRDVSTAFMLGRTINESMNVALTQENFIYGDLIRGNFIDSYNNLTLKTISALEWVDQHCSRAKYVLKTDDDMFINVPKLLAFLDNHSKEKRVIYGRLAKKWKPIRNKKSKYYVSTDQFSASVFPPFTTGPAYVISGDVVHELYKRSLNQVYLKLEDVFTTGIVAQLLNIKRVHVNEFLNRRIAFNPCNIRKTISVHMIKSNEQFDLWKKLLDQTTKCK